MNIQKSLFRLNRYLNQLAQVSDVHSARFEVLRLVQEKNPITLRKLCEFQQISMPTMSKMVDELQNENLVIRAQSKEDARKRWIVPTQKGIHRLNNVTKENKVYWDNKLSHLSEKQKLVLEESLELLTESLS